MKKSFCLAASVLALTLTSCFGQPTPPAAPTPASPTPGNYQQRLQTIIQRANPSPEQPPALAKFNLDFPGGTPQALVAAIEKAMGKPVNVIIQDESADTKLPAVKVNELDVAKLFKALSDNSKKYSNNELISQYSFITIDNPPLDNSLWTFGSYTKPSTLSRFDLDFPGGTPAQLVAAIEKAMGKHINVIINKEDENIELPPLKMDDVFLPQLFTALGVASQKTVVVSNLGNAYGSYRQYTSGYGFKSTDNMTDASVWYFYVDKPSLPPVAAPEKISRFYLLEPYFKHGFNVDDITTAIQTGWKMLGDTSPPEMSYHKQTKLLIAVGTVDKLQVIDNVLKALAGSDYPVSDGGTDPNTGLPIVPANPKTENSGK